MAARNEVAIDMLTRGSQQVTRELDMASNSLIKMGASANESSFMARTASGIWQGAMISIGNSINQFVMQGMALVSDALIGFNARTEQALIGFTTMLGSAQKAQGFLEQLQDFAAATPFEFDGLRQSANLIMAMGFEARDVIPLMTAAGDAVAALGLGTEAVQRVVYALGQMKAAGRVTGQDMMQLASMGIPAWKMLADAVGMTVQEAKKAAEQGLIDAETAIEGITTAIEEGDMGGMMAAQAKTFNGAMSTIKDTIQIVVAGAFKPMFDTVSQAAIGLSEFLGSGDFLAWADDVGESINSVIEVIVDLAEEIIPIAMEIIPEAAEAFLAFGQVAMTAIGALLIPVQALVGGLEALAPALGFLAGPLTTVALGFTALRIAAAGYAAVQRVLATERVAMALMGVGQMLTSLIPMFAGATGAAGAFATGLAAATGGLSLILPIIAAVAASFIDFGAVTNDLAMQFGDMGDQVTTLAKSLKTGDSQVRTSITALEEYGLSFEEATYVMGAFGSSAENLGDDVADAMEKLGIGVEDATMIVEALGQGWEYNFDKIDAATKETGVSWQTVFDDLTQLYGGMLTTTEIIQMMNEAADESPETFARLATELTPAEEAAKKLREEFALLTTDLKEQPYEWVESVKIGKDQIVATLSDGTEIVGATASEVFGQIEQIAKDKMAAATQAVSDAIDDIEALFSNPEDMRTAVEEFWNAVADPFKDVDQLAIAMTQLTSADLPGAFNTGQAQLDDATGAYVEQMLTAFDVVHPGMLEQGRSAGTGLFQGMDQSSDEIIAWATNKFAPQLAEGMSLPDALRQDGMDNMAAYIEGLEAREDAAHGAGEKVGKAGKRGAAGVDYTPTGRYSADEFGHGLENGEDGAHNAGEAVGKAGKKGAQDGSAGMRGDGATAGSEWATGLMSASGQAAAAAWQLANATKPALHGSSPPPEGPLHDIDIGGFNVGMAWAAGLLHAVPDVERAAMALASAAVPGQVFGDLGAPSFRPPLGGESLLGGPLAGGVGNITVNLNSTFPPTPAQGREVAQAIIPELQREMRNQGLA